MARDRTSTALAPTWVTETTMRACTLDHGNRTCGKQRPAEVPGSPETYPCPHCGSISTWFCQDCGRREAQTPTIPGPDGVRRCHGCIDQRFIAPVVSVESDGCPECHRRVRDHMRAVSEYLEAWQAANRTRSLKFTPGVLERMGLQHRGLQGLETRPAAGWSDDERAAKAEAALERYRAHLQGGRAAPPEGRVP